MIPYLFKSYLSSSFNNLKKIILKFLLLLFMLSNVFMIYLVFSDPDIQGMYPSEFNSSFFAVSIIFLFLFFRFRINEHKILLLLPLKQYKLTAYFLFINSLKFQSIFWLTISYIFISLKFPLVDLPIKITYVILLSLFIFTSIFNAKLAILIKSKNIFDYIQFILLASIFLFPVREILIAGTLIIPFNIMRINACLKRKVIQTRSNRIGNIIPGFQKDILLDKEIKLLTNSKKGFSLLISSLLSMALISIIYLLIEPHLQNTHSMGIIIFIFGSGYFMFEYIQYIFSWDYKSIGSQYILPFENKKVVISKLKSIYILLFLNGIISYIVIGLKFHANTIYLVYILNFLLLPHVFILIALSSYKKNMYLDKSLLNINYYQRPLKLIFSTTIIYLTEYLAFFIISVYKIKIFMIFAVLLTSLFFLLFHGKIINYYANKYTKWIKKFIKLEESFVVF